MSPALEGSQTRALTDVLDGADPGLDITVLDGPKRGKRFSLHAGRPFIIGKSIEATLQLDDSSVSRLHLELTLAGGRVHAKDLGSTNGSFLADHRFEVAVLNPGGVIRVGETHLQLLVAGADDPLPPSEAEAFGGLRGKSHAMRSIFSVLERGAKTQATVLITGETGTGKEVVAESIHKASPRKDGPFVVIDCASIPTNLVESELFGHVKGAFTHAQSDRLGAFQSADGGTIFLDELGELPVELQPRLLRVLETQKVKPVGSNTYKQVDVRVVAATHRNLEDLVRARKFRSDLFFRLAVIRVALPPLRERREDIPLLVRHFAEQLSQGQPRIQFDPDTLAALMAYDWPGNVRELRNIIQQAVIMSSETLSLLQKLHPGHADQATPPPSPHAFDAYFDLPLKEARKAVTAAFDLAYAKNAVEEAQGNVTKAAARAGLHRNMLHRILAREKGSS